MMMKGQTVAGASLLAFALLACTTQSSQTSGPATPAEGPTAKASEEDIEVTLCDGESKTVVPAGEVPDRATGEAVADALMTQWIIEHPERDWEMQTRAAHALMPAADNSHLITEEDGVDRTYGKISERDVETWKRETERVALMGSRVFHSSKELESTVGVSCDMCHPNAANTHPETYPKFQTQLGRVVLLRDMINWCMQHPVRAEALDADDPRMRALEAYIYAQRSGVELEYGKH